MHWFDWQPPEPHLLAARAGLLAAIRAFFAERGVTEVQTPCIAPFTVTDRHVHSLRVPAPDGGCGYLQTSPEYAMKRLLVKGSGPIYEITRVFRADPRSRLHRPEFTLLEWYRPGFDHHDLMDEVDALLAAVLGRGPARRFAYWWAMRRHAGIGPGASDAEILERTGAAGLEHRTLAGLTREDCLDLLVDRVVVPGLGRGPLFLYDYPRTHAALARIRPGEPPLAERFELYVDGVEMANGYHELTDSRSHRDRFEADRAARREAGLPVPEIDEPFLETLDHGLPPCAGVALGVDRLLMIQQGRTSLDGLQ